MRPDCKLYAREALIIKKLTPPTRGSRCEKRKPRPFIESPLLKGTRNRKYQIRKKPVLKETPNLSQEHGRQGVTMTAGTNEACKGLHRARSRLGAGQQRNHRVSTTEMLG